MNVLVAVNDNYVKPLMVMLESLFDNNTWDKIEVYLLYSNINERNLKRLHYFVKRCGGKLHGILLDESVDRVPSRAFSSETYYRLFAFKYLPETVEKVLFIDPDMLVIGSLESVYNMEMGNHCYAAVPDNQNDEMIKKTKKIFSINKNSLYVNSGLQLMNLREIRTFMTADRINDFVLKNAVNLPYLDQDVLNILYDGKILYLNKRYNYNCRYDTEDTLERIAFFLKGLVDLYLHRLTILHYMGKKKPWNREYTERFQRIYFMYTRKMKERWK